MNRNHLIEFHRNTHWNAYIKYYSCFRYYHSLLVCLQYYVLPVMLFAIYSTNNSSKSCKVQNIGSINKYFVSVEALTFIEIILIIK